MWVQSLDPGRCPGEGNGNPLPYSCLENPMDGGAWWAIVHRVAKGQTQLSGLPFPSPEDLPDPGIELRTPTLQADSLTSELPIISSL